MTREAIVQLTDKVRIINRGDKTLPDMLYDLLVTPTPHGHEANLHKFLPFMQEDWKGPAPTKDEVGNIILDIGKPKKDFRTVFSCHMDTVHHNHEAQLGLMYTLATDKPDSEGMIYAFTTYKNKDGVDMVAPSILGADDKLGMYIMLKMIENNIPGRYIFHIGEERGGIGSRHIATKTPEVLKSMRRAIAFDRMNYTDTIAFQSGGRCCSTEFSTALANAVNEHITTRHLLFKPDVRGVWTDTANYTSLVSECTNLSVGYFNQHTTNEHFDAVWFLNILLPALLKVDWEALPTHRDKTVKEEIDYGYTSNRRQYYGGQSNYTSTTYNAQGDVKMCDVDNNTPLYRIPKWHPITGIPVELNPEGLVRLCEGYVNTQYYKHREVAITIAALVKTLDTTQRANREMRRFISKNCGPEFKHTAIKMNAMRRLFNTYEVAKAERKDCVDIKLLNGKSVLDALTQIDDFILDFKALDERVTENFTRVKELESDINILMEDVAIGMYFVHASPPTLKACYKNLINLIKTHKDEPGFTRLFKNTDRAS
jgi:hypothetical protein